MKLGIPTCSFLCLCAASGLFVAAGEEVRYLSAVGNDAADGRSPTTAWRTLERMNEGLPSGGTALLRCGDVFYGSLKPRAGLDADRPTTVSSYGEGTKPVLSGVKILKMDPSLWTSSVHDRWTFDLSDPSNATGAVCDECNPGFLVVDGRVKPWRRFCADDLNRDWDFTARDGKLVVHLAGNPAAAAKEIRVALKVYALVFSSYTHVSNIAVRATGAHGMYGGWDGASVCEHVRISDCDFEDIGGSDLGLIGGLRMRFGNGVEFGSNCRDAVVERCSFRSVYDVAVTMQGTPSVCSWRDIHFRNCRVEDSSQAFEIWCRNAAKGVGFERCSFVSNRVCRVGGGWGFETRDVRRAATPLLVYDMQTDTVDIDVSGNEFVDCTNGLLHARGGRAPSGYRMTNNVVRTTGPRPITVRCAGRIGREGYGTANWWLERLNERRRLVALSGGKYDLVMLGDSITHNFDMRRDNPDRPGPGHAALMEIGRTHTVLNCGYSGDGYEHLLWRIRNGELEGVKARCIMINIGTNNRQGNPKETALGVRAILDELAVRQPQARVLLMAIFPCGANADDPGRRKNERVNEIIRGYADGTRIVWIDLSKAFLDARGDTEWIMPDRLHPTARGYEEIWLPAILRHLEQR